MQQLLDIACDMAIGAVPLLFAGFIIEVTKSLLLLIAMR